MEIETFKNVWDALEDDPAKRVGLKARSELMMAIEETVKSWNVSHVLAAKRLAITQPRLTHLLRGRFSEFDLDALVELAARVGLDVTVTISKRR